MTTTGPHRALLGLHTGKPKGEESAFREMGTKPFPDKNGPWFVIQACAQL